MSDLQCDFPATDPHELAVQAREHALYLRGKADCDDPNADELDALASALLAAEQENERLMSDLVFYGEHRHDCGSVTAEVPWDCDCGFSVALAPQPAPPEETG